MKRTPRELDVEIARLMGFKPFRPCDVKAFKSERHPDRYYSESEQWMVIPSGKPPRTHMIDAVVIPSYFSEPHPVSDYEVLRWVKSNWGNMEKANEKKNELYRGYRRRFVGEVRNIWECRDDGMGWIEGPMLYEPGDYTRAVLIVLGFVEAAQ